MRFHLCLRLLFVTTGILWLGSSAGHGAEGGNPLIAPGKSVGEIKIGMEITEVFKKLGKPTKSEGAAGHENGGWFAHKEGGGLGYELDASFHSVDNGHSGNDKVADAVREESPFFHTKEGINTGSSLADIWKMFPAARYSHTNGEDKAVEVYADDAHGIAFEVRRTFTSTGSVPPPGASWGACQAILVFEPASPEQEFRAVPGISSMRAMPDADKM